MAIHVRPILPYSVEKFFGRIKATLQKKRRAPPPRKLVVVEDRACP